MAVEIPNSSVAVYSGQWDFGFHFSGADDFIAAVQQELSYDGLTIAKNLGSGSFFGNLGFALGGSTFSVNLQILNQSGQELDDTDLVSQVNDAVVTVGGTVVSGGVTQVIGPPSGTNSGTTTTTATGVAASTVSPGATPTVHQCGDPSWGFFDDPAQYISCLTTKGLTTAGLLAIGAVVGLVLLFVAAPGAAARARAAS